MKTRDLRKTADAEPGTISQMRYDWEPGTRMTEDNTEITESSPSSPQRRRLGEVLQDHGLITTEQLRRALVLQRSQGRYLGEVLVETGAVSPEDLRSALSTELDVPAADLSKTYGDPTVLATIPKNKAFELRVIPLFLVENSLTVALADPNNLAKLDELRFLTGHEILPVLALEHEIERHLIEYYGDLDETDGESLIEFEAPTGGTIDDSLILEDIVMDRPVIRLVNLIFIRAIQDRASDIHLEPAEGHMVVRFRIDGRLQKKPFTIPANTVPAVVSRVKILAQCDIAEKRVPQDGKVCINFRGRRIDTRVSTFPTIYGEKIVMRLLDKDRQNFELDNIGMNSDVLDSWKRILLNREGIILVTGPTGSGKSSTLFATLRHLNEPDVNIVTLEDPVEYELAGTTQGQVHTRAGFTFASGLRAILRQDPDIILIGEIRDGETAQIAVQAALTGHLVLATLHTNDAPSAITRLVDIGVPRYLVASSVIGLLAQRLVRRICPDCKQDGTPTDHERAILEPWLSAGVPFLEGSGCRSCMGTGFKGRIGVYELITVDRPMREMISSATGEEELASVARDSGYRRMWWDGVDKAQAQITTLAELLRSVTPESPDS